jgi:hypothetical protein
VTNTSPSVADSTAARTSSTTSMLVLSTVSASGITSTTAVPPELSLLAAV